MLAHVFQPTKTETCIRPYEHILDSESRKHTRTPIKDWREIVAYNHLTMYGLDVCRGLVVGGKGTLTTVP